jgi:excisionase family DNA binding protein
MTSKACGTDEPLTYEVAQVAVLLGLTRNAVYDGIRNGDIPAIRIGKLLRIPRAALHRMLDGTIEKAREIA